MGETTVIYPGSNDIQSIRDILQWKAEYNAGKESARKLENDQEKKAFEDWLKANDHKFIKTTYTLNSIKGISLKVEGSSLESDYTIINSKLFGKVIGTLKANEMMDTFFEYRRATDGKLNITYADLEKYIEKAFDTSTLTQNLNDIRDKEKREEAAKMIQNAYKNSKAKQKLSALKKEQEEAQKKDAAKKKIAEMFAEFE